MTLKPILIFFSLLCAPLFSFAQQDTIRTTNLADCLGNSANLKNTHIIFCNPKTPNVVSGELNYLNGKENGLWIQYGDNGKIIRQTSYKNGIRDGVCFLNNSNGIRERQETYQNGKVIEGKCFDEKGGEIPYSRETRTYAERMPKCSYDYMKFIEKNINYSLLSKGIEGKVMIKFVVKEDGSIVQPKILTPLDEKSSQEIKRVIMNMPPWQPGMQDGEKVPVYISLPISV